MPRGRPKGVEEKTPRKPGGGRHPKEGPKKSQPVLLSPDAHAYVSDQARQHGVEFGTFTERALDLYRLSIAQGTLQVQEAGITDAELHYLCDICNGTVFVTEYLQMIWAEVEDAEPEYAEKWGIDAAALSEKLQRLSYAGCLAIVDAIQRFWAEPGADLPTVAGMGCRSEGSGSEKVN